MINDLQQKVSELISREAMLLDRRRWARRVP